MMYLVVGSGPAGLACAQALAAAGREVTILDSGVRLEESRRAAVEQLSADDPAQWTKQSTAFMREGMSSGDSGIPLKRIYGSDYPYREVAGTTQIVCQGAETKPSYALGGFSTVWGAATLPYQQTDIADWPISTRDLEDGYRSVLRWMPLAARADDLEEMFPLYTDQAVDLPMSRQASGLLQDLDRNREKLQAQGLRWGRARLAVNATGRSDGAGCAACGLCMYGCPRALIYSSDQSLETLLAAGSVHYRPGLTVRSFRETTDGVELHALDSDGGSRFIEADRVFFAAGPLNTTIILLRSLGLFDHPVILRDSQYFLLPLLRMRGVAGVLSEALHTLAQVFIEVSDEAISPYTVHLQTYTFNDLFCDPVYAKLGPLKSIFPVEAFLGRLMLFQGYLHSAHSASMVATLKRTDSGDRLELRAQPNQETKSRVHALARKLLRLSRSTGVLPLLPMIQMGLPGRGFHSGGSFPMHQNPGPGQSDILGRPYGLRRVHAVDATTFPSIPATTITYTVMANAYRIGTLACRA